MMKDWTVHIESNPKVIYGKPVIKGTRISVELILEKLGSGDSINDLIKSYPNLSKDNILACLQFASESIRNEIVYLRAS